MLTIPLFEKIAIIGDKPELVAEITSLFNRQGRYLPVIDSPRMARPDWTNEVIRRSNALLKTQIRRIILAGLTVDCFQHLSRDWPNQTCTSVNSASEAATTLRGWIKPPGESMVWGSDNLGVGLLVARRLKKRLQTSKEFSSAQLFVSGGTHFLIACEAGNETAQIVASNLAFATDATFLVIPQLSHEEREEWLEEIYSSGGVSERFVEIRDRARGKLPQVEFEKYREVLFITNGFPWGVAVPECATTHMFTYPDFGRCVIEGMWASQHPSRGGRNALLIHPRQVEGSEIEAIGRALYKNKTLVRIHAGAQASVANINLLTETLPFDVVVISTHTGDAPGERATYEFKDSEGLKRCLVIDHAIGFGYDQRTDKVLVQQFQRFHELDGVKWTDRAAKANLYVGTAIESWLALGDIQERSKYKIVSEKIPRVIGSMALQMHDGLWLPAMQGFSPSCSPVVLNNGCSSWHELSKRFSFAGARAYVGALFPITEIEAQELGVAIFCEHLGRSLSTALWKSQTAAYGKQGRRPYAMLGLPFASVPLNTVDSLSYVTNEYQKAIDEYGRMAEQSSAADVKDNCLRYKEFLLDDFATFKRTPMVIDP
ncbi:MAG: hypothetical protein LV473_23030 [Nitrospira sp.]|nr:hypothetical protein [Nitrospira sp.]